MARGETQWLGAPLSFAVHSVLILAAIRATSAITSVPHPVRTLPVTIAFPVPIQPVHQGIDGGTAAGPIPAPILAAPSINTDPEPIPVIPGPITGGSVQVRSVMSRAGEARLPDPVSMDPATSGPVVIAMSAPQYPTEELMRPAGAVDSVVVEYVVNRAGRVDESRIAVTVATAATFARSVRSALVGARFQPATQGSQAASTMVRQVFRFVRR
jgi:TonB family protein